MRNFFCKRCGCCCDELNAYTDSVDLREALHLMSMGFEPLYVDLEDNGERDTFYFRRTPDLQQAMADYKQKIQDTVRSVGYDNLSQICDIPSSNVSPIDETALDNSVAPRGHVREAFAYENWPVETRQAYIAADADTRRRMVDEAYQRG